MTETEKKDKLREVIAELAKDPVILEFVKDVEESPATTEYHYGRYMSFLSQSKTESEIKFAAMVLLKAGANRLGVGWAVRLLTM